MGDNEGKLKLELLNIAEWMASYSDKSTIAIYSPGYYDMTIKHAERCVKACGFEIDASKQLFDQIGELRTVVSEEAYPVGANGERFYWSSWYSTLEAPQYEAPFDCWITGETFDEPPRFTYCALLSAPNRDVLWEAVKHFFPDYSTRFIHATDNDELGDRFQGGTKRTGLVFA